jgi:hypothetical protein
MFGQTLSALILVAWHVAAYPLSPRSLEIVNESGKKVEIDWVNPSNSQDIKTLSHLHNGAKLVVESYANHTIHEPTNESCSIEEQQGGACNNNVSVITVSEDSEQGTTIRDQQQHYIVSNANLTNDC